MKLKWLVAIMGLLMMPGGAWAQQSTGTITGAVYDSTGAIVPGAKITAQNLNTHFTWDTVTTGSGEYRFSFLPVGTYQIAAEVHGFTKTVRTGVTLSASETVRADLDAQSWAGHAGSDGGV
ncbi:MAG: carboxypeptidase-like regulatory domain-containing protein [Terriglobia bacterium]|jgi:hypothetical protein